MALDFLSKKAGTYVQITGERYEPAKSLTPQEMLFATGDADYEEELGKVKTARRIRNWRSRKRRPIVKGARQTTATSEGRILHVFEDEGLVLIRTPGGKQELGELRHCFEIADPNKAKFDGTDPE